MAPDMPVPMAFPHGDDAAVRAALNEITAQELGQSPQGCLPEFARHPADALWREVADHTAVAVERFIAVIKQPIRDEGWYAALLGASFCVAGRLGMHENFRIAALEGERRHNGFRKPPSPPETRSLAMGQAEVAALTI